MKRRRQVRKARKNPGRPARRKRTTSARKKERRTSRRPIASAAKSQLPAIKLMDLYRPLKKPVTLRLDADVIAWFKKDGRRYQTRINAALRKLMEREMRRA